jgi:hypothetical protein
VRYIFSFVLGLALGASSVFLYSLYPPVGLILSLISTFLGIWAAGRLWGNRIYRFIAAAAWVFVIFRAGLPGINNEYLIEGSTVGISLINFGFIVIVIAILIPL